MENLQAQQAHEHAASPAPVVDASLLDKTNKQVDIITSGLDNEDTQKTIVVAFNNNHFHLLQSDKDKVRELTALISPNLPTKKIEDAFKTLDEKAGDEKAELMLHKQIELENIYAASLLSDIANKKPSLTTELLRNSVVQGNMFLMSFSDEKLPIEDVSRSLSYSIDEPIAKIAQAVELGKERSFLDKVFN